MHSAASVAYPVRRSRRAGWLLAALCGLGVLPVAWWMVAVPAPGLLRLALAGWTLGAIAAACIGWWRTAALLLVWDGQAWSLSEDDGPHDRWLVADGCLSVALDLQSLMLLRLAPQGGRARWLFVDRSAVAARWHGLRCAAFAPAACMPAAQEPAL
ncbi:hypothetical protein GT347_08560 [Xylophilus rhododendri]|uniref:Toxin CptA n=1 Tax=Xylophilus rhododendri TaxID=2697032 RepID=A0A857J4T3_9BURK|nr:hypothetical protein [Xylophilus rhododendri]QHI98041.1 hypothetical protein GT347_08560 [Xylophilus rhododendri]